MTNHTRLNILQAIETGEPFKSYSVKLDSNYKSVIPSHVKHSFFVSQTTIMKNVYPGHDDEKEKASISIMLKRMVKRGLIKKGRPIWTSFYWSVGAWNRDLRGIMWIWYEQDKKKEYAEIYGDLVESENDGKEFNGKSVKWPDNAHFVYALTDQGKAFLDRKAL